MIMMPYGCRWSSLQLTGYAHFWHPTGARRPVIAQGPPSPLAGDDQRVPTGPRRRRRGIARTRTESTAMDPADSGLMGALDPGTASIAPIARFGTCGKPSRLTHASGL